MQPESEMRENSANRIEYEAAAYKSHSLPVLAQCHLVTRRALTWGLATQGHADKLSRASSVDRDPLPPICRRNRAG